jgi:hypothetical protein
MTGCRRRAATCAGWSPNQGAGGEQAGRQWQAR